MNILQHHTVLGLDGLALYAEIPVMIGTELNEVWNCPQCTEQSGKSKHGVSFVNKWLCFPKVVHCFSEIISLDLRLLMIAK